MRPLDVMWVGLGGGLGSLFRWWSAVWSASVITGDFPLGTFLINVSGAFVIGYLSVLFAVDWRNRYGTVLNAWRSDRVLGGYTTFSRYATRRLQAARQEGWLPCRVLSFIVGHVFVCWLLRPGRRSPVCRAKEDLPWSISSYWFLAAGPWAPCYAEFIMLMVPHLTDRFPLDILTLIS